MFSRGSRSTGRHARNDRSRSRREAAGAQPVAPEATSGPPGSTDGPDAATAAGAGEPRPGSGPSDGPDRGPYDAATAPAGVSRLDLGSLRVPAVPGVELRVQADPGGAVRQFHLVHGDSALQLGAFAAPRSESIWDEVRAEIRDSLTTQGAEVWEVAGEYGTELMARMRTGDDGVRDLRFVGVSGPRWLVRAVYQGPAADPARAEPLAACLRGLVVDRGTDARPAREPLPLRLSDELAARLADQPGVSAPSAVPGDGVATAAGAAGGRFRAGDGPSTETAGGGGTAAGPGGVRRNPSPRPRRE